MQQFLYLRDLKFLMKTIMIFHLIDKEMKDLMEQRIIFANRVQKFSFTIMGT